VVAGYLDSLGVMKAAALISQAVLAVLACTVLAVGSGAAYAEVWAFFPLAILSSMITIVAVVRPVGRLGRRLVIALNSAFVLLFFAGLAGRAVSPPTTPQHVPLTWYILALFVFALPYCFSIMALRRQSSEMESASSKHVKVTLSKLQLTGIVVLTAILSAVASGYVTLQATTQVFGILVLDNMVSELRVVSTSLKLLRDDHRDRAAELLCTYLEDIAPRAKGLDDAVHNGIFPLWHYSNSAITPKLERIEKYRATTIDAKFEKCR
jgi:hypothetical protein